MVALERTIILDEQGRPVDWQSAQFLKEDELDEIVELWRAQSQWAGEYNPLLLMEKALAILPFSLSSGSLLSRADG